MPARDHLPLHRLRQQEPRRKKPGFGLPFERDPSGHGRRIRREIDAVVAAQAARTPIPGIKPELILKVTLTRPVDEDEWRRAGFTVIAQNPDNVFVLFADNRELEIFKTRLAAFEGGPQGDQKGAPYANLFGCIEHTDEVAPADRIGPHLKSYGITSPERIDGRKSYVVDVELWDPGPRHQDRSLRAWAFSKFIEQLGGNLVGEPFVTSTGLILVRAELRGTVLREILDRPEVSLVDLPPLPDLGE